MAFRHASVIPSTQKLNGGAALTFAVDGHGALRALADVQEAARDQVAGRAAVQEEEVVVVEAGVAEALGVVDLLVEADDGRHVVFPEVGEVRLGGVERVTCRGRDSSIILTLCVTLSSDV